MLPRWSMETTDGMGWTIPLHVIMWTAIGVILVMAVVVAVMR
jgi:hypothetical protein